MVLSEDDAGALPKDIRAQSCLFNYVVSAQKPTSVTHSTCGNFTSTTALNLIIGKCTRIEIHTVTDEGLQGILDVPVYGRISCLELVRISSETKDLLFVSTERYKFFVIEYDENTGELITRANGDARGLSGRPTDSGQIGVLDPDCRLIGLYLYEGLFKVIPIQAPDFKEAYDVRLEELEVIDLKFIHRCLWPTLAVLYQDPKGGRHLKTYEIHDKDFVPGVLKQHNLESGSRIIIPVPNEIGGVVVVGEVSVMYIGLNIFKAVPTYRSMIRVSCCIDSNGSRFLLSDSIGMLYLLMLQQDVDGLLSMSMEPLGHVSPASSLTYLDNGIVFVGSGACDSQLIRLNRTPISSDSSTCVEVIETFTNLGPIVDFCVVDLDRQGQGQVVTCSGVYSTGSLRVIRNGIGINEHGCVEMTGIKAMWSLKRVLGGQDEFLIVTFVGETRAFHMAENGILREYNFTRMVTGSQSLYCGNVIDDQIVQITVEGVFLLHAQSGILIHQWNPPNGREIDVATAVASHIVLGTRDNCLLYLEVVSKEIIVKAEKKLNEDISCLDLVSIGESKVQTMVAVGTWALDLTVYSIPQLTVLSNTAVEGDFPPRSVKFAKFEDCCFLLCALGDGYLLVYPMTEVAGLNTNPRKLSLGTKPVSLHAFNSNSTEYVFAASDRPSVIYYSNKKLLYSNLNQNEVSFMTSFNFRNSADTLAIATDGCLLIGNIDDVQKLHIRTVPLGEQPRRIAHQDSTRTFGVLTIHTDMIFEDIRDFHESSFLRLIDDQMFEVSDSFKLENFETGCSIMSVKLFGGKTSCYVVGTAYVLPDESEPSKGRLLVFQVINNKLVLCVEREVKGAVYNLNDFNGYILAGINSRVQLFECLEKDDSKMDLRPQCSHVGHILALHVETRGDFIVVGDLMKSISLLIYKSSENVIEERARDFNSSWITSVKILDDDTYLGAENGYNIFLVHKNSEAATDEERMRLEVVGEMHVGDLINRFRAGSLVMKQPDGEHIPTILFGTINGVLGLVASLPETIFKKLSKVQEALRKVVKGVGGLSHSEWRSFENERRIGTGRPEEQRLFVDGDLIEQFLELRREKMMEVAAEVGDLNVDEICKLVEDLARLH